jgi:short-subunit dehydrogenase
MSTTQKRVAIVTGASAGIGRALALAAVDAGFAVVAVARRAERLAELAAACATLAIDVTAADAAAKIVDFTMRTYGRIDVVVNNAGTGAFGDLLEQTDAQLDAQWRLHVMAPVRLSRAALPQLKANAGQLVFVGSGVARVPIPGHGAYAAVKAAIRAAAIQLRRELKADGIAVTYVDPGLVDTEFHEAIGVVRRYDVPAAPAEKVARAILRGMQRRSVSVSGTPWQTFGTVVGEWSSTWADPTLIKMRPQRDPSFVAPPVTLSGAPEGRAVEAPAPSSLESALEPLARRMERVKLSPTFLREALVPGATLELNEMAMRWAGMPNKNERAAMKEVLEALTIAGYLELTGEDTWKVVRAAD